MEPHGGGAVGGLDCFSAKQRHRIYRQGPCGEDIATPWPSPYIPSAGDPSRGNLSRQKYRSFKSLLAANNRALELINDLEHHFYQDRPFTLDHIVTGPKP